MAGIIIRSKISGLPATDVTHNPPGIFGGCQGPKLTKSGGGEKLSLAFIRPSFSGGNFTGVREQKISWSPEGDSFDCLEYSGEREGALGASEHVDLCFKIRDEKSTAI